MPIILLFKRRYHSQAIYASQLLADSVRCAGLETGHGDFWQFRRTVPVPDAVGRSAEMKFANVAKRQGLAPSFYRKR